MSLPATDAFTDTNGTNLTAHSGGVTWSAINGTIDIQSNMASPASGSSGPHYFDSGNTYNNDQYAFTTVGNFAGTGGQLGPGVRMGPGTTFTGYHYEVYSTGREFYKRVAGAYTGLGTTNSTNTPANGDLARLEANGTTITPKYNGVTDSGIGGPVTDSSIASGSAGLGGWWDATNAPVRADAFEGGNLGAVAAIVAKARIVGQAVNRAATY